MVAYVRQRLLVGLSIALGLFPLTAFSNGEPVVIGDFGLVDHQGTQHTLSRMGYNKAVVIITQANSCTENIDLLPKYKLLRTDWQDAGIEFLMMNSSSEDDLQSVRHMAQTYNIDFPIMLDEAQLTAETLQVTHAGEILVVDPNTRLLLYRGPLNAGGSRAGRRGRGADAAQLRAALARDELPAGVDREQLRAALARAESEGSGAAEQPTMSLEAVLAKVVAGEVKAADTPTVTAAMNNDCALEFPGRAMHADSVPDYATEVAPVLLENCARCHVEGGIGPFAMNRHLVVRGFAPMIREVLMTKRMPPMQVDPHYNHFENANYISKEDLQTLVHWIDAGAPRGDNPVDPLEENVRPVETEWQLGPPDLIVEVPAFEVPASGVIDYFNHTIELGFAEDKYVRAVQFIPGDSRVLHHLLSYITSPTTAPGDQPISEDNVRDFLEGYAPGKIDATTFPADTGVFVPAGHNLSMQMHYTAIGVPVTDKTRVGLYFYDEPPKYKYLTYSISHWSGDILQIPPGEWDHRMNHNYVVPDDMMLYALRPHMHYRGKSFRFSVVYPDQSTEVLMNVPNYNFGWQPTYRFTEPKFLPAGSRIITDGVFDNSIYNRGVPDPTETAVGGLQSWDEMFIGYITYTLPNNPHDLSEPQLSAR